MIYVYAKDFIYNISKIVKLYENMLKVICEEYDLTLAEAKIINFLYYSDKNDTAADIAELTVLQKSNISHAVEGLFQKSLLKREQDKSDRRKIHLTLTPDADPIIRSIDDLWKNFQNEIFSGIPEEEFKTFQTVNKIIQKNISEIIV